MIALYVVAGLFEAFGLLLAAIGFKRTWAEFGTGENLRARVLGPLARRVSAGSNWVEHRVRKLLRKPKSVDVQVVAARSRMLMGAI